MNDKGCRLNRSMQPRWSLQNRPMVVTAKAANTVTAGSFPAKSKRQRLSVSGTLTQE